MPSKYLIQWAQWIISFIGMNVWYIKIYFIQCIVLCNGVQYTIYVYEIHKNSANQHQNKYWELSPCSLAFQCEIATAAATAVTTAAFVQVYIMPCVQFNDSINSTLTVMREENEMLKVEVDGTWNLFMICAQIRIPDHSKWKSILMRLDLFVLFWYFNFTKSVNANIKLSKLFHRKNV